MKQFSNKSVDMSLRVASLDYLGIVASRLRKDAVSSQDNHGSIDEIVTKVQGILFVLFFHSEANSFHLKGSEVRFMYDTCTLFLYIVLLLITI